MKVIAEKKMVPKLVEVKTPDGSHWEWQMVEGFEVELPPTELKNGETLSIDYTITG
jgi:hypothetical protein